MASSRTMTLALLMHLVSTVSAVALSWPHKKKKSMPWLSWSDPNYAMMSPREKDFTGIRDGDLLPVFQHAKNQRFGRKLVLNNIHGGAWAGGDFSSLIHEPTKYFSHATDEDTIKACNDVYGAIQNAGLYKTTWQKQQATQVGIPYVTVLMEKYSDNYNVQHSCFSFLGAAVSGSGMLQEQAFLTLDMAPFLVKAIKTYQNDPPLVGHVLRTVGEMTDLSNRSAFAFVGAGGLEAVISAMKANRDDPDFLADFFDGMAGLARVSKKLREELYHQNLIQAGMDNLQKFKNHYHMASKVLSLMSSLATDSPTAVRDIERTGYVPEVLSIIKRAEGHRDVAYSCVLFLRSMFEAAPTEAERRKFAHILINRDAIKTFLDILKSNTVVRKGGERTEPLSLRTMELLYIMEALEPITGKEVHKVGRIPEVVSMYYTDLKTHNYACAFLKLLVWEDWGVESCIQAACPEKCGGIPPAEAVKRRLALAEKKVADGKAYLEGVEAEALAAKKKLDSFKENTKAHVKAQADYAEIAGKLGVAKQFYFDAQKELESRQMEAMPTVAPPKATAATDEDSAAEQQGILEDEEEDLEEEAETTDDHDLEKESKDNRD